tara:strand:- start:10442 stop:11740 length:1299 start_codon:yes stop_codon:yes gene_type:complete
MTNWYYGIIEDRNDPLQIGRVRVRVHGVHTDNKQFIATPDLPWSQVLVPTSSASLSGFGHSHGLVEGSSVFGMFRDDDLQDFVVFGGVAGYSQKGYKETITGEILDRSPDKGFNDPRRATEADYKDTADGLNPPAGKRPNSLALALDKSPHLPDSLTINYDGSGSTITEPTDKTLPYYPLADYYDESDINRFARGQGTYDIRDNLPEKFKLSIDRSGTMYPFNKVHHTESGHLIEMDDSVGAERLAVQHRSGTFYEIHKDGSEVHQIVNDHVTVTAKDDKVYIGGNADVVVESGNVTINVNTGNVDLTVAKGNVTETISEGNVTSSITKGNFTGDIGGNFKGDIGGTTDISSSGKVTLTGNSGTEIISDTTVTGTLNVTGATKLQSTLNVSGSQTNSSTITASGDVKGAGISLKTHTHVVGGSAAPSTGLPK